MTVVSMSEREFSRLDVLSDLDSGRIRVGEACDLLGLKRRQVFRLLRGLRDRGAVALVSGRRAQPSNVGGSGARPFFVGRPGWVRSSVIWLGLDEFNELVRDQG
jgi:predicted DNA-binding protein (UPF0251 family)